LGTTLNHRSQICVIHVGVLSGLVSVNDVPFILGRLGETVILTRHFAGWEHIRRSSQKYKDLKPQHNRLSSRHDR